MDLWKWSRKKTAIINAIIITVTSIPCVLGFNVWSGFMPFGKNTNVMDLEDFLISNLILPIGSLIYIYSAQADMVGDGIIILRKLIQAQV